MNATFRILSVPDEGSTSLRIAAIYLAIGSVWMLVSERALLWLSPEISSSAWLETAKGWLFVLATAVVLYVLIRRDMTRIRQSQETFRSLVENSLTGISIIQNGALVYQNPEQERMMGALPRPVLMKDLERVHLDDVEKVRSFYEAISSGESQRLETSFRFYPDDGRYDHTEMRWVICRANRIMYGGKEAVVANTVDVTRTKVLERAVLIQDKMSSLGRVAAGLAHEIRNPLSGINIYVDTLKKINERAGGSEKVSGILEQLSAASRQIESVIRRVMDFSKPAEPKATSSDMNGPVSEAANLIAVTLRKSGIRFTKDLQSDLPPCRIDVHMIEQVVLNLINNAAEALRTAQPEKRIAIRSFVADGSVRVTVSDSGPGIEVQNRDRVFEPFYTTKTDGSGIGLSICHRIVTDHGGTLTVGESEWGGASIELAIPVAEESP